ncbi:MAG TPA: phosphotransferase [Sphingobium sp.]|nr:phosphotransferase [Sphingobium sp.]
MAKADKHQDAVATLAKPGPSGIADLSAAWLSQILARAGFEGATVRAFATEKVGTGQAAICCRIMIDYVHPDPAFPASIIAKFQADDPASRQAATDTRTYLREVNFYRDLRQHLTIPTPACYHADIDGDGPAFALLLQDLAPARQGDQIAGCSAAVARAAVDALVGLHAPTWRNKAILDRDWLGQAAQPERAAHIMDLYRRGLPAFMDRCGAALSAPERALMERIARDAEFPSEYPLLKSYCLTHADYRSDNMLICESAGSATIHVVDWQTLGVGNPMKDVSYFLGGCLLPEDRRICEEELVRHYHGRLTTAGVSDYDWDDGWNDYRRASFHGLMTAVAAVSFVTRTERGDRLFAIMAQRHARMALELGADEFLGQTLP